MGHPASPQQALAARLARWMFSHPKAVLAAMGLLLALSVSALPRFKMQAGVEPFIDRGRPEQLVLDKIVERFVSDDLIVIAYDAQDLFAADALRTVRKVSQRLRRIEVDLPNGQKLEPVAQVDSLTTVKDLEGAELSFRSVPLVPDPVPEDAEALARIRARAKKNALIHEQLLSSDDSSALIVVRPLPNLGDDERAALVARIKAVLEEAKGFGGVDKFHFTGRPVLTTELAAYMQADLQLYIPLIVVIMAGVLLLCLRRVAGMLLSLLHLGLSLVVGMGLFPLFGFPLDNLSSILAPLLMVMATASMVHYLSELAQNARSDDGPDLAERTLAEIIVPAVMVSFTTLVGFLAIGSSSMPALQRFAIVAGTSVVLVQVMSFCAAAIAGRLRPASYWVAPGALALSPRYQRAVEWYCGLVQRRAGWVFAVAVGLVVLAAAGIPRIYQDSDQFDALGKDTPLRKATDIVDKKFGGALAMVVSVKGPTADHFLQPEELKKLEALEAFIRESSGSKVVVSPVDFVKLMHQGFFSEDPKEYRVPDTREQVAQLLLLNGDKSMDEYLDPSRGWARIVARFDHHGTAAQGKMFGALDAYLQTHFPASQGYQAHASGEARMFLLMLDQIVQDMSGGLGMAFLLIFLPIFIVLGSLRAGLFSIPSNIFPIILVMGVMGWLGIPLNESTSTVASIALGIVVDDTIQFLQHMRTRLAVHGDVPRGLRETLLSKGAAATVGMLVFTCGFAVTMLSHFKQVFWFGALSSLAILLGAVAEFLVLPPLILLTGTKLGVAPRTQAPPPEPLPAPAPTP